jgi:hypothetical protein
MKMVSKISIVISVSILCGCGALNSYVDQLEEPAIHYYEHTRAIIVVKKEGNKLYCKSAAGVRFYRVIDNRNRFNVNDTIDLFDRNNEWVLKSTDKFLKTIE